MKSVLFIALTLLSPHTFANDKTLDYTVNPETVRARLCNIEGPSVIKKVLVPFKPNFFFRYLTGNQTAYFSSSDKQNHWMNLETKEILKIPGVHDPVPLWGEDVITVPRPANALAGGGVEMEFYRVSDIKNSGHLIKPFYSDPSLKGVYQSIGQIGTITSEGYVNRVLTDDKGITYRDYRVSTSNGEVTAITPASPLRNICKNFKIKTPMLSKNGQGLAGFDTKTGTTKIWRISETSTDCQEVADLGFATGKVDFSFSNRYLTFHMNSSLGIYSGTPGFLGRSRYTRRPTESRNTNVFVYDRETKLMNQLTFNSNTNSYFPVWDKKDQVVYISYSGQGQMEFVISSFGLDGASSEYSMNAFCDRKEHEKCIGTEGYQKALVRSMIGNAWLKICTSVDSINPHMAMLTSKNIDSVKCKMVVEDLWWGKSRKQLNKLVANSYYKFSKSNNVPLITRLKNKKLMKQEMDKLSAQELLNVCDMNKKINTTTDIAVPAKSKGLKILETQCMSCHGDKPFENLNELRAIPAYNTRNSAGELTDWAHASIIRMKAEGGHNRMPIGAPLTNADLAEAINYLEQQ